MRRPMDILLSKGCGNEEKMSVIEKKMCIRDRCKTGRQPDVRRKSTETCCQKIKSVFTTEDYCAILKQYD